ncbi:MAG: YtxH domain-containing protein [Gemmatimonadetes bacterium]|nr:YtxH domain-containing protein [Gemmatimonadota bacterium]
MANNGGQGDGHGFLTGFLIGGIAGFVAGVLFAPKSGEETRALLMERGSEWRDKAEELAAAARERIASATEEGRRAAARVRGEERFDEFEEDDEL